jgi:hypothetical protein
MPERRMNELSGRSPGQALLDHDRAFPAGRIEGASSLVIPR